MKESPGKAASRVHFFEHFLPERLHPSVVRAAHYLVLLGDEPRELPYLDALHVPRSKVTSVERDDTVNIWQINSRLGITTYFGELEGFLAASLHTNNLFQVMRLDVEGSYLTQLDPAMTSVLLFSWRNHETIVATHSSIGRDSENLYEGIKSLAVFLWLAPDETKRALATLVERYARIGTSEPLNLALRDLFWLRSHMEHAAIASMLVGQTRKQAVVRLLRAETLLWDAVRTERKKRITLGDLETIVEDTLADQTFRKEIFTGERLPLLGVGIGALEHLLYRATTTYQRVYYARYDELETPVYANVWLARSLRTLVEEPLVWIDRHGAQYVHDTRPVRLLSRKTRLIPPRDMRVYDEFKSRELKVPPPHLAALRTTMRAIVSRGEE